MLRVYRYGIASMVAAVSTVFLSAAVDYVKNSGAGKKAAEGTRTESSDEPSRGITEKKAEVHEVIDESKEKITKLEAVGPALDYFLRDFRDGYVLVENFPPVSMARPTHNRDHLTIISITYFNFPENTRFLSFYIPYLPDDDLREKVIVAISSHYQGGMDEMLRNLPLSAPSPGDQAATQGSSMVFSGRIYIYTDSPLSSILTSKMTLVFAEKGAQVVFRGENYVQYQATMSKLAQSSSAEPQPTPRPSNTPGRTLSQTSP